MSHTPDIGQVLASIPQGAFKPYEARSLQPELLDSGKSNDIYVLRDPQGVIRFVLRLPHADSKRKASLLEEFYNHMLAADHGVAPPLIYHDANTGLCITPYINAKPLEPEAYRDGQRVERVGLLLKRLHDAPVCFAGRSNPLRWHERRRIAPDDPRLHAVEADGVQACLRTADKTMQLLKQLPWARRPYHGDTVCSNILFDGDTPLLIDWQLSAMGSAENDVATFAVTAELDDAGFNRLLDAYAGDDDGIRSTIWLHAYLAKLHFLIQTLEKVMDGRSTTRRQELIAERVDYLTWLSTHDAWQSAFTLIEKSLSDAG